MTIIGDACLHNSAVDDEGTAAHYHHSAPSLLTLTKQSRVLEYFFASVPCIFVFTTSKGLFPGTKANGLHGLRYIVMQGYDSFRPSGRLEHTRTAKLSFSKCLQKIRMCRQAVMILTIFIQDTGA